MKSAQIRHDSQQDHYTDLQVMESRAGFYVGSEYIDPETGFPMPGTKDSSYFITAEAAQQYLDAMIKAESV